MSKIYTIFQSSLERAVREHLVPNRTGKRENWYWSLEVPEDPQSLMKLKLILSWVLGNKVIHMTAEQVLKHMIDEYRKSNYYSFMQLKYGDYTR